VIAKVRRPHNQAKRGQKRLTTEGPWRSPNGYRSTRDSSESSRYSSSRCLRTPSQSIKQLKVKQEHRRSGSTSEAALEETPVREEKDGGCHSKRMDRSPGDSRLQDTPKPVQSPPPTRAKQEDSVLAFNICGAITTDPAATWKSLATARYRSSRSQDTISSRRRSLSSSSRIYVSSTERTHRSMNPHAPPAQQGRRLPCQHRHGCQGHEHSHPRHWAHSAGPDYDAAHPNRSSRS
jgi:hypothetical protein